MASSVRLLACRLACFTRLGGAALSMPAVCRRIAGYLADPFRRVCAEQAAVADVAGWGATVTFFSALALKTWWGKKPGLALLPASFALYASFLLVLIRFRREAYVRGREMWSTAGGVHFTAVILTLVLASEQPVFVLHGGSALLLLALLSVGNTASFQFVYWTFSRSLTAFLALVLPLMVLLPASASARVCRRLLEDPKAKQPLASLYHALHWIHTGAAHILMPTPALAGRPAAQCMLLNTWLLFVVGVALPLQAIHCMERRGRRLMARQQQQRAGVAPAGERDTLPWRRQGAEGGGSALYQIINHPYYVSCLLWWGCACVVAATHGEA